MIMSETTVVQRLQTTFSRCYFPFNLCQPSLTPVDQVSNESGIQFEEKTPGLRPTVWDQQNLRIQYPKLEEEITADVIVVGGGIAGISIAYNLITAGKSVALLEAKCIGHGQTGKTTAHLMPWFDDYYFELEKHFGKEKTFLVGESHRKSIDWIENVVREENIECNFKRLDGFLFPTEDNKANLQKLQMEFDACKRAGFTNISVVDLGGDPAWGSINQAIRFPNSGEFHPLLYLNGLAQAFVKKGGKIYEDSPVFQLEGTKLTTADGKGSVSGSAVVLATNSPIHHNVLIHARQKPERSYVIGFKVNRGDIKKANWWDTASPYHYTRLEEKEDYDVLIVGGEDHPVGILPGQYSDPYKKLEEWARPRWPAAGEVIYQWSGMVYKPTDFLGLYGLDPGPTNSNIYIATGDSGQGMTGSTIAGILITDLIMGKSNPWIDIYSPSRVPPPSMSTLQGQLTEAVHTKQGLKDNIPLAGVDPIDIEDLAPKCGAVVQKGLKKVAAYRDGNGNLHQYSAVCPHLKCIVKWNPVDSTFDCPCHGSQFDSFGRLINGPAKANLSVL